ncbi:MAG: hypothetical protein ACO3C5_01350 [Ilumatobacteraceae bacterium]|jgi:hypothetical protein
MATDDEQPTMAPAPLPRHERSWRHPSELGQQRRTAARRAAPPLGPRLTFLVGTLCLGLVTALVALVLPREAPREALPATRNAVAAPAPSPARSSIPGAMTVGGDRFVLAVRTTSGTRFVTAGDAGEVVIIVDGRRVELTAVQSDSALGVSVLRSDVLARFDEPVTPAPDDSPPVGTAVVVRGTDPVAASIGVSMASDSTSFVPLAGDVLAVDILASAPIEDLSGRLLGLYTERDGARGYVPLGAIDVLLSRSR